MTLLPCGIMLSGSSQSADTQLLWGDSHASPSPVCVIGDEKTTPGGIPGDYSGAGLQFPHMVQPLIHTMFTNPKNQLENEGIDYERIGFIRKR